MEQKQIKIQTNPTHKEKMMEKRGYCCVSLSRQEETCRLLLLLTKKKKKKKSVCGGDR